MFKKVIKKLLILIFIVFVADICFSAHIDVYCPYCNTLEIEVLNSDDGVCRCNNCGKFILIINGTIYTEEAKKLPLDEYVVHSDETGGGDENVEDKLEKQSVVQNNSNTGTAIVDETELRDNKHYEVEPEIDIEKDVIKAEMNGESEDENKGNDIKEYQVSSFSNLNNDDNKTSKNNINIYFDDINTILSTSSTIPTFRSEIIKSTASLINIAVDNTSYEINYLFIISSVIIVVMMLIILKCDRGKQIKAKTKVIKKAKTKVTKKVKTKVTEKAKTKDIKKK